MDEDVPEFFFIAYTYLKVVFMVVVIAGVLAWLF